MNDTFNDEKQLPPVVDVGVDVNVEVEEGVVLGAAVDEEVIVEFNVEIEEGVELGVAVDMVFISEVLKVVVVDIVVEDDDVVVDVDDDVDVVDVVVDVVGGIVITGIVMFEMGEMRGDD